MKHKLSEALLCLMLGLASLMGAPMRPEEIEELMHQMNQPKIAHTLPDEHDKGKDWDQKQKSTVETLRPSR